jgi:hypothetical protein
VRTARHYRDGVKSQQRLEMTEQNLGDTGSQSQSIAPASSPAPVSTPVVQQQEKMLSQHEVNEIIGRTKNEAYERGKRDGSTVQQSAPQQPAYQPQQSAHVTPQTPQQHQALSPDDVKRIMAENAPQVFAQQVQAQQWAHMENNFIQKLEAEKNAYPEFDQRVTQLDLAGKNRDLIPLLNSVDNAAAVLSDIADNPKKLADLRAIASTVSPQAAFNEMRKISDSIKQNQAAANQKSPNTPLSQVQTSVNGTDNGSLTISDIRKNPLYRG